MKVVEAASKKSAYKITLKKLSGKEIDKTKTVFAHAAGMSRLLIHTSVAGGHPG